MAILKNIHLVRTNIFISGINADEIGFHILSLTIKVEDIINFQQNQLSDKFKKTVCGKQLMTNNFFLDALTVT